MELKKFSDFSLNESKKKITKRLLKNLWDLHYNKFLDKAKELIDDGDIDENDLENFLQEVKVTYKGKNKPKSQSISGCVSPTKMGGGCDDEYDSCGFSKKKPKLGAGCGSPTKMGGGCDSGSVSYC